MSSLFFKAFLTFLVIKVQNPFNSNPLTRNRSFPTVEFVKPNAAKNLKVPTPEPYDPSKLPQNNLTVPNQLPDPTKTSAGGLVQYDKTPLSKDEWTKWRFIDRKSEHGDWGNAWGREEAAKEQYQEKISREYAERSAIENAKLSAELEKDDFRKQLLADIDSGKLFPNTKLEEVDESKNSTISQKQTINETKENNG